MTDALPPDPSAKMPLPSTTRLVRITVQPQFAGQHPKAAVSKSHGHTGGIGWYRATAVFARPGAAVVTGSVHLDELVRSGESHVGVPVDQIRLWTGKRPDVKDALIHTLNGVLSHATLQVHAASFRAAEECVHAILGEALSFLAVVSGAPIEVKALRLHEEASDTKQWTLTAIGGDIQRIRWDNLPNLNLTPVSDGLKAAFANFREGLNSFNVFYKFLCFFKVAKYCLDRIKRDQRKQKQGSSARHPPQTTTIPNDLQGIPEYDATHLRRYAGRTYSEVVEVFTPVLRDSIAHLTPGMQWVNPDHLPDLARCTEAVPVMQFVARQLLLERYTSGNY